LVELMVTIALLSIGFLAAVSAFKGLSMGIFKTKTKSLAVNLAQEKMEVLKDKSYYRLRVTSAPVAVPGTDPAVYSDAGNYAEETVYVGGIPFFRYAVVEKVRKSASGGALEAVSWNEVDTGLKRISVGVVWTEADEKKQYVLVNLRENPSRAAATVSMEGTVADAATMFPVSDAIVSVVENPSWRDRTDSSGRYSFNLSPGNYTRRASSGPYFSDSRLGRSVDLSNTPLGTNFTLTKKANGTVTGTVWIRNHPVISQVGATLGGLDDEEFVELYNPSTYSITMYNSVFSTRKFVVKYVDIVGNETELNPIGGTTYNGVGGQIIPANGFYLLASKNPIGGVQSNAYYNAPADRIPKEVAGGIVLCEYDGGVFISTWDAVAWGRSGYSGPPKAREGNSYFTLTAGPGHGGLAPDETIERIAYATSTLVSMEPGTGVHRALGNAYDDDVSADCWVHHDHNDWAGTLQNWNNPAFEFVTGETGTPANGAYIFADDGMSNTAVAAPTGTPPRAQYTLTSVATGTWTLSASSGTLYISTGITVSASGSFQKPLHLSSTTDSGYVSGKVSDISGTPIPAVNVVPGGGTTDPSGFYRLALGEGLHNITANPGSLSASEYVEASVQVNVTRGQIASGVDITLSKGGGVRGRVTSDGTNALPDVPVSIFDSGTALEVTNELTDSQGYFEIAVPTGSYYAVPIGEYGEVVTPAQSGVVTVTGGATVYTSTFTVGPAVGYISGTVTAGGQPIPTGVLIVATTGTITGMLPDVDATLRSSGLVYYMATSGGTGRYTLSVRNGTYNLYAWYTDASGNATPRSLTGVTVNPGQTTTADELTW